jgi:hypothetical protein
MMELDLHSPCLHGVMLNEAEGQLYLLPFLLCYRDITLSANKKFWEELIAYFP